jgi:hypothetical protein
MCKLKTVKLATERVSAAPLYPFTQIFLKTHFDTATAAAEQ